MNGDLTEISISHLLKQDIPQLVGYGDDIVMLSDLGEMKLLHHPARLRATTVLICLRGEIDCSINLRRMRIAGNQLLVSFSSDIIQIHHADGVAGYALMLSDDFMQRLQIDFRLRVESYIDLRGGGPVSVPYEELHQLKPYYQLFRKNMADGNHEVIAGLAHALSYSILALVRRCRSTETVTAETPEASRPQQIFDRFMTLLHTWHCSERSLQFYADKMCLTPKYVSGMIKTCSGKGALQWINEYVVLEAKMMLRYTSLSVQEISVRLNFPTQSAFGKYFKQQTGVGPKRYRADNL